MASSSAYSCCKRCCPAWGWENYALIPGNVPHVHLFRHEWLRAFRAVHRLGNLLLVGDLRIPGRHLHGLRPARGRGLAARAQPPGASTPARAIRGHGGVRTCWPSVPALGTTTTRTCSTNTSPRRTVVISWPTMKSSSRNTRTLDQPKLTAVDTAIDIFPARRSFSGTGRFTLQNKSDHPISEMHLTDQYESVSQVQFDRPFHLVSRSPRNLVQHLCARSAARRSARS